MTRDFLFLANYVYLLHVLFGQSDTEAVMLYVVSTIWTSPNDGYPRYADFNLIPADSPGDAEIKYSSVKHLIPYVTEAYCFGTLDECRNPEKMDCQQLTEYMKLIR